MNNESPAFEQFREFSFLNLPVGIYLVTVDGRFLVCNRIARKFLGLPLDGVIEKKISDFYLHPDERNRLIEKLYEVERQGQILEAETLHFRIGEQSVFLEDYCTAVHDPKTQNIIGFAGCMIDITHEHEARRKEKILQEEIEELRLDIGRILHANTTTLVMVKQTLDAVVEAFEPKPFSEVSLPTSEEIEDLLTEHSNALAAAIERFTQSAEEERRLKALSQLRWKKLMGYVNFLQEFKERIPTYESYAVTLRKIAHEVGQIHGNIVSGYIPREPARELQNTAWNLERLTNLIEVLNTRVSVIQMDHTIHSLREFITSDTRNPVERQRLSIKAVLDECTKHLAEYARSLKIEIDTREVEDIFISVNEREMVRALTNLLHNAIKYSWRKESEQTRPAWVTVRTQVKEKKVYIEFENWGVPIKREEIEKGKIFDLGYRGELSKDRGRLGTGIGLTDARRVAESCGGGVEIDSHPANRIFSEKQPQYYEQPFLTKVTMVLPIANLK